MNTCINCDKEIADGMYRCLECADLVYRGKIGALNKRPQLEEDEAEMVDCVFDGDSIVIIKDWKSYHCGYRQGLRDAGKIE